MFKDVTPGPWEIEYPPYSSTPKKIGPLEIKEDTYTSINNREHYIDVPKADAKAISLLPELIKVYDAAALIRFSFDEGDLDAAIGRLFKTLNDLEDESKRKDQK